MQHKVLLQVMREGIVSGEGEDLGAVRQMARELAIWLAQHAQSMDADLALHLRRISYDPLTGRVTMPEALPAAMIHGCCGANCSNHAPAAQPA